jgi:hypothetical protein
MANAGENDRVEAAVVGVMQGATTDNHWDAPPKQHASILEGGLAATVMVAT